jgi:Zn-dependent protease with chaperone function
MKLRLISRERSRNLLRLPLARRLLAFGLGIVLVILPFLTLNTIAQVVNPESRTPADILTPTPVSQPKPDPQEKIKLELPEDPFEKSKTKLEKQEDEARLGKIIEADRLYKAGKISEAVQIYQTVKRPFTTPIPPKQVELPIVTDPNELSPGGQVYWREAKEGFEQKMESRAIVAIDLLLKRHPEFLPGQLLNTQIQAQYGKPEQSLATLEALALRYPRNAEVQRLRITALNKAEKWLDASITARQYALLSSTSTTEATEFTLLADNAFDDYRKVLRRKINGSVIGNVITGAIGTLLTGGLIGPLTATQSALSLIQGEAAIGKSVAKQAKSQLPMLDDAELNAYVTGIGQKLAKIAGRKDFEYEFNIVLDENINAFALPGGPVFINAGAIAKTDSEAELAGLIGHEISHSALTHGLQLMAQGNLITSIVGYIPYAGGLVSDVFTFDYSRDMERQADDFGTRILVGGGYAADGLHSLMLKLQAEDARRNRGRAPIWLSSHPGSDERLANLEAVILNSGFDRYAYEGADRHASFKAKATKLIQEEKKRLKAKKKNT